MTDHPLTNDTIENIYHSACGADGMLRAAADWQLEQVIEWLYAAIFDQPEVDIVSLPEELRKAMRPTQEGNND